MGFGGGDRYWPPMSDEAIARLAQQAAAAQRASEQRRALHEIAMSRVSVTITNPGTGYYPAPKIEAGWAAWYASGDELY